MAQEHFTASVIRGRMLGLARGWGLGVGPLAVIACLAGEQHDLGALAFGLALRSRGWRISYFGADTAIELETIELSSRVSARDAAHGIVLGSPFRGEIERLDASALERATTAVVDALRDWDGRDAPMSAHVATAAR